MVGEYDGFFSDEEGDLLAQLKGRRRPDEEKERETARRRRIELVERGSRPFDEVFLRDILKNAAIRFVFELQFGRKKTLPEDVVKAYLTASIDDISDSLVIMRPGPEELVGIPMDELEKEIKDLIPNSFFVRSGRKRPTGEAPPERDLTPQVLATGERRGNVLLKRRVKVVFNPLMFYQPYGTVDRETGQPKGVVRTVHESGQKRYVKHVETAEFAKPVPFVKQHARYTGIRLGCDDGPADLLIATDRFFIHGRGRVEVLDVSLEKGPKFARKKSDFVRIINKLVMTRLTRAEREEFEEAIPERVRGAIIPGLPAKGRPAVAEDRGWWLEDPFSPPRDFGGTPLIDILTDAVTNLVIDGASKSGRHTEHYEQEVHDARKADNAYRLLYRLTALKLRQSDFTLFRNGRQEVPEEIMDKLNDMLMGHVIAAKFDPSELFQGRGKNIRGTGISIRITEGEYKLSVAGEELLFSGGTRPTHFRHKLDKRQKEIFEQVMTSLTELGPLTPRDLGGRRPLDGFREAIIDLVLAGASKRGLLTERYETMIKQAKAPRLEARLSELKVEQRELDLFKDGGQELPRDIVGKLDGLLPEGYHATSAGFDISNLFMFLKSINARSTGITLKTLSAGEEEEYQIHVKQTWLALYKGAGHEHILMPLSEEQIETFKEVMASLTKLAPFTPRKFGGRPLLEAFKDLVVGLVLAVAPRRRKRPRTFESHTRGLTPGTLSRRLRSLEVQQTELKRFKEGERELPKTILDALNSILPEEYTATSGTFDVSELFTSRQNDRATRKTGICIRCPGREGEIEYEVKVRGDELLLATDRGGHLPIRLDIEQKRVFDRVIEALTEPVPLTSRKFGGPSLLDVFRELVIDLILAVAPRRKERPEGFEEETRGLDGRDLTLRLNSMRLEPRELKRFKTGEHGLPQSSLSALNGLLMPEGYAVVAGTFDVSELYMNIKSPIPTKGTGIRITCTVPRKGTKEHPASPGKDDLNEYRIYLRADSLLLSSGTREQFRQIRLDIGQKGELKRILAYLTELAPYMASAFGGTPLIDVLEGEVKKLALAAAEKRGLLTDEYKARLTGAKLSGVYRRVKELNVQQSELKQSRDGKHQLSDQATAMLNDLVPEEYSIKGGEFDVSELFGAYHEHAAVRDTGIRVVLSVRERETKRYGVYVERDYLLIPGISLWRHMRIRLDAAQKGRFKEIIAGLFELAPYTPHRFGGTTLREILEEVVKGVVLAGAEKRGWLDERYQIEINAADAASLKHRLTNLKLAQSDMKMFEKGGNKLPQRVLAALNRLLPEGYRVTSGEFDVSRLFMRPAGSADIRSTGIHVSMSGPGRPDEGKYWLHTETDRLFFSSGSPHDYMKCPLTIKQKDMFKRMMLHLTEVTLRVSRDYGGRLLSDTLADVMKGVVFVCASKRGWLTEAYKEQVNSTTSNLLYFKIKKLNLQQSEFELFKDGTHEIDSETLGMLRDLLSEKYNITSGEFYVSEMYTLAPSSIRPRRTGIRLKGSKLRGGTEESYKLNVRKNELILATGMRGGKQSILLDIEQKREFKRIMERLTKLAPFRPTAPPTPIARARTAGPTSEFGGADVIECLRGRVIGLILTAAKESGVHTKRYARELVRADDTQLRAVLERLHLEQSELELLDGKQELPAEIVSRLDTLIPRNFTVIEAKFNISELFGQWQDNPNIRDTGITISASRRTLGIGFRKEYLLCAGGEYLILNSHRRGRNPMFQLDIEQKKTFQEVLRQLTKLRGREMREAPAPSAAASLPESSRRVGAMNHMLKDVVRALVLRVSMERGDCPPEVQEQVLGAGAQLLCAKFKSLPLKQADLELFKDGKKGLSEDALGMLQAALPKEKGEAAGLSPENQYELIGASFDVSELFLPYRGENEIRGTGIYLESFVKEEGAQRGDIRRKYHLYATEKGLLFACEDKHHNIDQELNDEQKKRFTQLMVMLTRLSE